MKIDLKFIKQFCGYFVIGTICTLLSILLLYIFTEYFNIYYIISNIISFILVIFLNYFLTKKYIFKNSIKINKGMELFIYFIIGVSGVIVDSSLVFLFTNVFCLYYILSKLVAAFFVFLWNFFARKILYTKFSK